MGDNLVAPGTLGDASAPTVLLYTQREYLRGICPLRSLENFVFLEMELCNLVQMMSKKKKKKKKKALVFVPDRPKFCI